MMARSHAATAAGVWVTAQAVVGPPHLWPLTVGTIVCAAGAMLPDLDRHGLVNWASGGHRHATHSLLGASFVGAAMMAGWQFAHVTGWLAVAVVTGVVVHIAGDMCTYCGCPLLWPDLRSFWLLPKRLRISTGGKRRKYPTWWQRSRGLPVGEYLIITLTTAGAAVAAYLGWF